MHVCGPGAARGAPAVDVVLNLPLGVLALALQLAVVARPPLQQVAVRAPVPAVLAEDAPTACMWPASALRSSSAAECQPQPAGGAGPLPR